MKTRLFVAGIGIVLLVSVSAFAFAEEGHDHHQHGVVSEEHGSEGSEKNMESAIEVGNKICPVSGEQVGGEMGDPVKFEYNGKIYNLCCNMCAKDFKKNPEKYAAIAEAEAMEQEAGQDHGQEEGAGHQGHEH